VTVEAGGLAIKSGNAIILRGGKEARASIQSLAEAWRKALEASGLPADVIQCLDDPDRRLPEALMHLQGLDLLIPRGGRGLIETVVKEATVPVIETGIGNCHLYVDRDADLEMGLSLLVDGKLGNPAVCNALETLLVHRAVAAEFLPLAAERLGREGVVFHGDEAALALVPSMEPAQESDFADEYLGLEIAVKVVGDIDEALNHIRRYGSMHSEAIVTDSYRIGQAFLDQVDAACVYWNASTRFSDGFEFGLGAEVGISTQKLHARGPMGLEALTTWKTIAYGHGQTRDF
jgi:glutamate-5-semialdehyde dehydrogenase